MPASSKQLSYLFDLVVRHPDFQKQHNYDIYEATEDWVKDWINEKYADRLDTPLSTFQDLESDTASALITHLLGRK